MNLWNCVDDIVIASASNVKSQHIIDALASKFALKDVGALLGLHITRNRHKKLIELEQSGLCKRYIEKFYHPEKTKSYQPPQIGCLSYLANGTRPDIAFDVNYLARKIKTFGDLECKHLKAV